LVGRLTQSKGLLLQCHTVCLFGLLSLFGSFIGQSLGHAKSSILSASLFRLQWLTIFSRRLRMLLAAWLFGEEWCLSPGVDLANFGVGGTEVIDAAHIDLSS